MSLAAMKQALEALEGSRRSHHYCEDTWYSCPKHEDGCANQAEGDECNCGADKANEKIDQAITALRAAIEQAHGDWDELEALRESLREHMAEIHRLQSALEQEPVAWVYQEGLEALKSGRPWTAYGSNGYSRIPLYLNDAVALRVEPPAAESGAGFESLPASPTQQEKNT